MKGWGCDKDGNYKLKGKIYEFIHENYPGTQGCIEDSLWEAKATCDKDWYEDIIMNGVEDYWFVELK